MPLSAPGGATTLGGLNDVDTTGVAVNSFGLRFNGVGWDTVLQDVQWNTAVFQVNGKIEVANGDGGSLHNEQATLTNPTVLPIRTDVNSGMTGDSSSDDTVGLVAGDILSVIYREVSNHILVENEMEVTITASTTQTQGNRPLTSSYNEISAVANANDVITLPLAAEGRPCLVINNGVNTLQIFPTLGDNLGAGVDISVTLATGLSKLFFAWNTTNWNQVT